VADPNTVPTLSRKTREGWGTQHGCFTSESTFALGATAASNGAPGLYSKTQKSKKSVI
jgi:hypothetical protein